MYPFSGIVSHNFSLEDLPLIKQFNLHVSSTMCTFNTFLRTILERICSFIFLISAVIYRKYYCFCFTLTLRHFLCFYVFALPIIRDVSFLVRLFCSLVLSIYSCTIHFRLVFSNINNYGTLF